MASTLSVSQRRAQYSGSSGLEVIFRPYIRHGKHCPETQRPLGRLRSRRRSSGGQRNQDRHTRKGSEMAIDNGYTSEFSKVYWPKIKDGSGRIFWLSTVGAATMQRVDLSHDGVPFESPSNKEIMPRASISVRTPRAAASIRKLRTSSTKKEVTTAWLLGWPAGYCGALILLAYKYKRQHGRPRDLRRKYPYAGAYHEQLPEGSRN